MRVPAPDLPIFVALLVPDAVFKFVNVKVCPEATLITPAEEASTILIAFRDKLEVTFKVVVVEPLPILTAPLASPICAAFEIEIVPPEIIVPPE